MLRCNKYHPGFSEHLRFSTFFTPSTMACNNKGLRMVSARRWCSGLMALWTLWAMNAAPTTCNVNALPAKSERNLSPRLLLASSGISGQRSSHMPCNRIRSTPRTTRLRFTEYGADDGRGQVSMSTAQSVKVLATSTMASQLRRPGCALSLRVNLTC